MNFVLFEYSDGERIGCILVAVDKIIADEIKTHNYQGVRLIPNREEALLAYKNALEKCLRQVKKEMKK